VARLGGSSVRYELALFADDAPLCAARGEFTHVYVDRATRRPVPLPAALREALQPLVIATPA
jgi:acyl-CoA thioester hydrolase